MVLDQVGIHLRRAVDYADGSDRYALQAQDSTVPTSAKHRINGLNLEPATGRGPLEPTRKTSSSNSARK